MSDAGSHKFSLLRGNGIAVLVLLLVVVIAIISVVVCYLLITRSRRRRQTARAAERRAAEEGHGQLLYREYLAAGLPAALHAQRIWNGELHLDERGNIAGRRTVVVLGLVHEETPSVVDGTVVAPELSNADGDRGAQPPHQRAPAQPLAITDEDLYWDAMRQRVARLPSSSSPMVFFDPATPSPLAPSRPWVLPRTRNQPVTHTAPYGSVSGDGVAPSTPTVPPPRPPPASTTFSPNMPLSRPYGQGAYRLRAKPHTEAFTGFAASRGGVGAAHDALMPMPTPPTSTAPF